MISDPTIFQKLWDKGVDIAAGGIGNAIGGVVAAVTVGVFWKWKKLREAEIEEQYAIRAEQRHRAHEEVVRAAKDSRDRRERVEVAVIWLQKHLTSAIGAEVFSKLDATATEIERDADIQTLPEFRSFLGFWKRICEGFPRYSDGTIANFREVETLREQVSLMDGARGRLL